MNGWRCPEWCAQNHQCTVRQEHPAGVHASDPMRWNTAYGSLVAVRFQDLDGRNWLELRATASLDKTSTSAQQQASQLAVAVDLAIRKITLPPLQNRSTIVHKGRRA